MSKYTTQRQVSGILLYVLTVVWLGAWIFGWYDGNNELTISGFFLFWVFAAASLVFTGLRGAIEE